MIDVTVWVWKRIIGRCYLGSNQYLGLGGQLPDFSDRIIARYGRVLLIHLRIYTTSVLYAEPVGAASSGK